MCSVQSMSTKMCMVKILAPSVFVARYYGSPPGRAQVRGVAKSMSWQTTSPPRPAEPRRCGARRPCMPAYKTKPAEQKSFQRQFLGVLCIFITAPVNGIHLPSFGKWLNYQFKGGIQPWSHYQRSASVESRRHLVARRKKEKCVGLRFGLHRH